GRPRRSGGGRDRTRPRGAAVLVPFRRPRGRSAGGAQAGGRGREPRERRAPPGRVGRRAAAHRSAAGPGPAPRLPGAAMNFVPRNAAAEAQADADEGWYKSAIIYQLHVKAFADSNHDGIGDFAGLTEKLDYLQDLGVTALWLLPFYPSPGRDD